MTPCTFSRLPSLPTDAPVRHAWPRLGLQQPRWSTMTHATPTNSPSQTSAAHASKPGPSQPSLQAQQGDGSYPAVVGTQSAAPPALQSVQQLAEDEYETVYMTETVTEEEEQPPAPAKHKSAPTKAPATTSGSSSTASMQAAPLSSTSAQATRSTAAVTRSPVATVTTANTPLSEAMQNNVHGWVVAFALLLAARLSRDEADAERADLSALQVRQAESRVQSAELRAKRKAFLEQERIRKEQEAAKRLEEARKKAKEEEEARAAREAAYREAASKETARVWAEQQAARAEFLAQEARMAEELAKRTAQELVLREAELAKRKEEEEKARAAYEREQQRLAEEAARAAEEARVRAEEEERVRRLARRQRRAAQTRFCLGLDGAVTVQTAPPGMLTTQSTQPGWERGPQIARLTVSLAVQPSSTASCFLPATSAGPSQTPSPARTRRRGGISSQFGSQFGLGPSGGTLDMDGYDSGVVGPRLDWPVVQTQGMAVQQAAYESAMAAVEGCGDLTGPLTDQILKPLFQAAANTLPDQASESGATIGTEPSQLMDTLELTHWQRVAAAQCDVASRRAVSQVAPLADRTALEQNFQVRLIRAVLPQSHEDSLHARMQRAVTAVQAQHMDTVVTLASQILEDEDDMEASLHLLPDAWPPTPAGATQQPALPPLTHLSLIYALLMDHVTAAVGDATTGIQGGTTTSQQPAVQAVLQLARYQLQQAAKRVEPDGLTPTAQCVRLALGPDHPLTQCMQQLADNNLSAASRLRAEQQKKQSELEVAAALLKAQDPTAGRVDPNNPVSRQALVPVPERLWAIRNTANNLVRFGDPNQASEAIASLLGACDLCASHYGPTHPSGLGVLLDTREALLVVLSRADEASETARKLQASLDDITKRIAVIVQGLCDRFLANDDSVSAVVLSEATTKELSGGAESGPAAEALASLARSSSQLLYELTPAQVRTVMAKRRGGTSQQSLLRSLAREFTEELGVYQTSGSRRGNRLDQWKQGAPLTPLR